MDWKKLILELQQAGLSQADLGARIGKSQAWVSAAACGRYEDLKWRDGQALIALHDELLGIQTKEAA
jgi:transcriptional regulator with XRE-family HTH domain